MRRVLLGAMLALLAVSVPGQVKRADDNRIRLVEIPREWVLMTIANQADSPLRIEDARFLMRVDKPGIIQSYKVRNVSAKPIVAFTITSWSITGSGGTLPIPRAEESRLLQPGETMDSLSIGGRYETVPLTDELIKQLQRNQGWKIKDGMSNVYIMLVDRVIFSDGSAYKDEKTSNALKNRLQEVDQ